MRNDSARSTSKGGSHQLALPIERSEVDLINAVVNSEPATGLDLMADEPIIQAACPDLATADEESLLGGELIDTPQPSHHARQHALEHRQIPSVSLIRGYFHNSRHRTVG